MSVTEGPAATAGDSEAQPKGQAPRWLVRTTVFGLAALTGLATTHAVRESDPFWHLTQGRAVLASGARTLPDPVALEEFSQPLVVPEWLWDVSTYGLYTLLGWPGLSALTAALAALFVLGLWHLGRTLAPRLSLDRWLLVAGPTCVLALARLRLRPQAAFLALLPWFLSLSYRFRDAHDARTRLRYGSLLAALTLVWAQLHGSFVIAPVLVGLTTWSMWREPQRRRSLLLLALAMGVSALTSAHGTDLLGYVLAHGAGDASLFIRDTSAPSWDNFNPAHNLYGPLYLAGVVACVLMLRRGGRPAPWPELLLAAFGSAMGASMVRLFVAAGVLLVPLALRLLAARTTFTRRGFGVALALSTLLLGLHIDRVVDKRGPLLRTGPLPGRHPVLAAAYLGQLDAPQRILSGYDAGAPLGFWLEGHARTFVDARTPVFFDDTDFAVARDAKRSQAGLVRLARLHRATSVVTRRTSPWCEGAIEAGLVPAVAGPTYTTLTFPEAGPRPVLALLPCGPERLPLDACRADKRARLDHDIERHRTLGSPALANYLHASLAARCDGPGTLSPRDLPPREQSHGFEVGRNLLLADIHLAHAEHEAAVALLAEHVVPADPRVVDFVQRRHGALPPALARHLLQRMFEAYRDTTPDWMLVALAHHAARARDAASARFFAFRAAVRGRGDVVPVLHFVSEHGQSATARAQAKHWIQVLGQEAEEPPVAHPSAP